MTDAARPVVSVVIATRDRFDSLRRCLDALDEQDFDGAFEVVVVDDGGLEPLTGAVSGRGYPTRVLRAAGEGPANARNLGWRAALASIIVFTDDDVIPSRTWLRSAAGLASLATEVVGIEGPTHTKPYDVLYQYSVEAQGPGAFLTCNVAYRRTALEAVDGFFPGFPASHCEDIDLGLRIRRIGPLSFDPAMTVEHVVRDVTLKKMVLDGRVVASEAVLFSRHPDRYATQLARRFTVHAAASRGRQWMRVLVREPRVVLRSPCRLARWTALLVGQSAVAVFTAARYGASPGRPLSRRLS